MPYPMEWIDLGRVNYEPAFELQLRLHALRRADEIADTILIQENPPVITLGRSASEANILAPRKELQATGVAVIEVSRGGDVSYHGPGQLVVSAIMRLRDRVASIHEYLRLIEQVAINLVAEYGIQAERIPGASGVWTQDKKIAAVGIAISHGVTLHGLAVNVDPDLSHFELIRPCGLENTGVTSIAALTGSKPGLPDVRDRLLHEFGQVFESPVRASGVDVAELMRRSKE